MMDLKFSFYEGLAPAPQLLPSECAERYYTLEHGKNNIPGPFKFSRSPFLREIVDSMGVYDPMRQGCLMGSVQTGKSLGCVIMPLLYRMIVDQGTTGVMSPNSILEGKLRKERMQPIFDLPMVKKIIIPPSKKAGVIGSTMTEIRFAGGYLYFNHSGSTGGYRQVNFQWAIIDDADGCASSIPGEGSTIDLFFKRTNSYPGSEKIMVNSTPTTEDGSAIFRLFQGSDQREYMVECPHCATMQFWEWGGKDADYGFKFDLKNINLTSADIHYQCKRCHRPIYEHHKTWMQHPKRAYWLPKKPEYTKRRSGWHISGAMAEPGVGADWLTIVSEFQEVHADPERYPVWLNQRWGLPSKVEGQQPKWKQFYDRPASLEMGIVPKWAKILTAGVDVHDNRLNVIVLAWGPGEECAVVWAGEFFGSVAESQVWENLDNQVINRIWNHESGAQMRISCAAIDSGDNTQIVYSYCRKNRPGVGGVAMAIKGSANPEAPIMSAPTKQDLNWQGDRIKGGIVLYNLGVGNLKQRFYLLSNAVKVPGPKYIHYCQGLDKEFFRQIFSEKLVKEWHGFHYKKKWIVSREDGKKGNHYLDAYQYATAGWIKCGGQWIDYENIKLGIEPAKATPKKTEPPKPEWRKGSARRSRR